MGGEMGGWSDGVMGGWLAGGSRDMEGGVRRVHGWRRVGGLFSRGSVD